MAQLNNLIVTGSSRFLNKVYFSNGGTFNGNLNVTNNGDINITNGNLQLYGKIALQGYDSWLRINEPKQFEAGIYCGTGILRTDGEFQVGANGDFFKANSSAITCNRSLIVNAGVDFGYGATIRNAGLELYFSTPFIDFHFNNSNNDYTSRIIEGNKGVLYINGVTCSSSNLAANNVSATNVNVSSRINADAATAIFNNVYVKDELRSTTWAIDNITNLGSTFYVSPCIIFTNPSVYINSKSGTTVTLTITDNNIISSSIGGQTWTSGSKIKLMGRINTSVLGVVNGTMARQLNTTTAKTAYITLNFATTDDCAGIEQGKTYSGSSVGDLKMMMYEVNLNVNGTTKNRPVGIRMSSYNEDKKSSIDIYNGTVDDGKPIVRMGYLGGLPAVNGENPTGYGFYAVGNAFFSGRILSGSGKIGNWNIGTDSLYIPNRTGISSNTGKFAFWAGESNSKNGANGSDAVFRVGHNGVLIATNATITGSVTATSGAIGSFTLDSTYLQSSDKTVGLSATASNWAFWAGGTNINTAKFRVNHAGQLWATSATISGSITATSGRIGNCSIENGTLNITNASSNYAVFEGNGKTNGYFHIATIKIIGNYIDRAMVIGAQSRGYGYSEINLQFINANNTDPGLNFFNQTGRGDWYIKKTATSTWNIYCKKSEVWGYTRILKYIDSPNVTLTWGSGNADLPASSTRATQLAGSSAWCYNNDSTYINGGNIYTGTVTANAIAANAITADKISANAITSDKINVSQLSAISANLGSITGGSINIGGKFIVDSNGNFTATNGSLTGTVNATTMRAKQKYSIYDSSFNVYQDVIQWFGSSLSIGLTGGDDNGTLTVAGAYFDFLDNNIDCNGNLNIVNDGNLFVAKTTTTGSLSVSNTSTFNGATTFNSTLTCKSTSTFTGSLKAGSFTFRDYSEIDDNNIIYRRPVASAGSNKSRVAILQGTSNNKIIIKAQYNSTNFTNVTFTGSSSDVRLKKDIKDSSVNALSKIMQMQIREFNWKQTGVHQELGCVADELELIDPLLTVGGGYDDDGTMNIKSIDTLLLSEYAIKGIQELYRQNKQQQKRIEYLELQLNNK